MKNKTAGVVGAISVVAPIVAAAPIEAKTVDEIMNPRSYAELLQPIPNASALLKEIDAARAPAAPKIQTAQFYYDGPSYDGYGYYPRGRWYHHHHHWNGGGWGYGGGGWSYGRPRYHHHHHHHHHHNSYWNPW